MTLSVSLSESAMLEASNEAVEKANFREKPLCNLLIYIAVILAF
jgi:hypothetical protein